MVKQHVLVDASGGGMTVAAVAAAAAAVVAGVAAAGEGAMGVKVKMELAEVVKGARVRAGRAGAGSRARATKDAEA